MNAVLSQFGKRLGRAAQCAWRAGLDFVYPRVCLRCGAEDERTVSAPGVEPVFCRACSEQLAPAIPHSCERCAAPVGPFLDTSSGCIHCRNDRFAFPRVVRLGVYDGALRALCMRAKQPGQEALTAAAAALIWERESSTLQACRADLAVPVPHHWMQRIARSQDPAEVLAGVLARRLGIVCESGTVRKIRMTPRQAALVPTERRINLRGAFRAVRGCDLTGWRVLVVDDVLTTGSTAHEVAKVLRNAGADVVAAVVIARGIGR